MTTPRQLLAMCLTLAASLPFTGNAFAQAQSDVAFARGQTSTVVNGFIVGRQYRDYIVRASAGQTMAVRVVRARPTISFNVLAPGSRDVALYNSSTGGNSYSGRLTRGGPYRIRVYQDRSSGMRGERSPFVVSISVTGRPGMAGPGPGRPPAIGGRPGSIVGIAGMPAVEAIDELSSRGFAGVDSFSSGNTLYGIYYYRPTRLCVQTTSANSRIVDIRDIKTHPKCR